MMLKMNQKTLLVILAIITLSISFPYNLKAGDDSPKPVEGEIGAGFSIAPKAKAGMRISAEVRWNLPESRFDIGLQAENGSIFFNERMEDVRFNLIASAFADYNFRTSGKSTPFIGVGAGYFMADSSTYVRDNPLNDSIHGLAVTPRIGIELLHHLRLTAHYRITMNHGMSHLGISLGWAFGGGPR